METTQHHTLDQQIKRLEGQLQAIDSLIILERFKEYGKYAHYQDRHYHGGKAARIQVRRTMRKAYRTLVVLVRTIQQLASQTQLSQADTDLLKQLIHLQTRYLILQNLFM